VEKILSFSEFVNASLTASVSAYGIFPVMPESILIVEDEPALQDTLGYNLKKEGYTVEAVGDGRAALEAARRLRPDLIVLDIMLPEMDGFEVARILRKEMTSAILMLTARDDEIDRVVGLEVGADDYLTKPFSMRELDGARQSAVTPRPHVARRTRPPNQLTRTRSTQHAILTFNNLALNTTRREVTLKNEAHSR
jgi:DNA-binding response OmpR family regulator